MGQTSSGKVASTTQKQRKATISKQLRLLVWNDWIGGSVGRTLCPLCRAISIQQGAANWHCGHIVPEAYGGQATRDNLRPVCSTCNISMGTKHMRDFAIEIGCVHAITRLSLPSSQGMERKPDITTISTTDKKKIRDALEKYNYTLKELKDLARRLSLKGFSKYRKEELKEFILKTL